MHLKYGPPYSFEAVFRSKDAVVNLWNLPRPPHGVNNFARPPPTPLVLENFSKSPQGDLTSLHWNSEGTLLAIGSYDSVLRICTNKGTLYFSHPQHQVGVGVCDVKHLLTTLIVLLRRVPYLRHGFQKMAAGY